MAISPSIPTSFVPRQPVQAPKRRASTGTNIFMVIGLGILGITVVAAAGVFAYEQYLNHVRDSKAAELAQAQKNINQDTVQQFIRLSDRFAAAKGLLTSHVELSQLFDVVESVTLQNVRFTSFKVTVANDHTAQLVIQGTAKNFNSLAAQSNALAAEKRIKRAIFSGITLTKSGTVGFTLTADIDPALIVANNASSAGLSTGTPAAMTTPVATSTMPSFPAATPSVQSIATSTKTTGTPPAGTTVPGPKTTTKTGTTATSSTP